MSTSDAEREWQAYYARKRQQRLAEAAILWREAEAAGVTRETLLTVDFLCFGSSQDGADALASQLSEHYSVEVARPDENGYWYVNGTSRPYGVCLTKEQHAEWVQFMSEVSQSHGCVFSTWSLGLPGKKPPIRSEDIEVDG